MACFDGDRHCVKCAICFDCTFLRGLLMFLFFISFLKLVVSESMPPGGYIDILQSIKLYMVLINVGNLQANLFKHIYFFLHTFSSTILQYVLCAKC